MPLTDAKLRTLKPKEKPYKVGDFQGLYVTVTPTGSCLWHMKYRVEGREKRLSGQPGRRTIAAATACALLSYSNLRCNAVHCGGTFRFRRSRFPGS